MSRFHHGRDDVTPGAPERAAHAETDAPEAMIERLLGEVFRVFYAGLDGRRWLQDQRSLLQALTWPAVWLNDRGVGLSVVDYEAKMREIISTIERRGDIRRIKLVPAYLGDCVRKHFQHHGDEIYEARKHVRNALDLSLLKGRPAPSSAATDAVPALLKAHAVLAVAKTRAKIQKNDGLQGTLF
jgi:hypothetical protein